MNHFKSVLAGVVAAVIAIVILAAALFLFVSWRVEPPPGDGVVAVVVTPHQIFPAAVIGFALGFWRSVRKQRQGIRRAQSVEVRTGSEQR